MTTDLLLNVPESSGPELARARKAVEDAAESGVGYAEAMAELARLEQAELSERRAL